MDRIARAAGTALLIAALITGCDGNEPSGPDGGVVFTAVVAGEDHTCGIVAGGQALCWGFNNGGQLGDSSTTDRSTPTRVAGGFAFSALSGGINHTCGLSSGGTTYCWGRNVVGQLGDDTLRDRNVPVPLAGGFAFTQVSAGGQHSCALLADGRAFCWGWGDNGQLGIGESGIGVIRTSLAAVSGNLRFATLSAGGLHTCGALNDGSVYCWGFDGFGALGTSAAETCDDGLGNQAACATVPVRASTALPFSSLSAGVTHTCGLTTSGAAHCWGRNVLGQLGDGTTLTRTTPTPVSGGLRFSAISAGNFHTCGVSDDGAAYCWGGNHRGQLGDNSLVDALVPTPVSGDIDFVDVSAGGAHTCGLSARGRVYCWGQNFDGELGIGIAPEMCNGVPCSRAPIPVSVDPEDILNLAPAAR